MKMYQYYVYILTNRTNKVLYVDVTNDIQNRCHQHKQKLIKGFTQRYNVDKLVYFEQFDQIEEAIGREKQINGLLRIKKIRLIEGFNCDWLDLCPNGKVINPSSGKNSCPSKIE